MKNNLKKAKKKGFTLVELIAVIAILAILAAIIVPRVSNMTDAARDKTARADVRTILTQIEVYNANATSAAQITDATTLTNIGANVNATGTALVTTGAAGDALTTLQGSITTILGKNESITNGTPAVTTPIVGGLSYTTLRGLVQ